MFERGRLDHLGFTVTDLVALRAIRDRLLAVDASSGDIRSLGPMLSLRFVDPDGLEGEINCYNTEFDPSTLRDEDEVIDPDWLARTRRALQSGAGPATAGNSAASSMLDRETQQEDRQMITTGSVRSAG